MRTYRDFMPSSERRDPLTGEPVWPLSFVGRPNPHSPGRTAPAAHSTQPTPSGRASANHRVR